MARIQGTPFDMHSSLPPEEAEAFAKHASEHWAKAPPHDQAAIRLGIKMMQHNLTVADILDLQTDVNMLVERKGERVLIHPAFVAILKPPEEPKP